MKNYLLLAITMFFIATAGAQTKRRTNIENANDKYVDSSFSMQKVTVKPSAHTGKTRKPGSSQRLSPVPSKNQSTGQGQNNRKSGK